MAANLFGVSESRCNDEGTLEGKQPMHLAAQVEHTMLDPSRWKIGYRD